MKMLINVTFCVPHRVSFSVDSGGNHTLCKMRKLKMKVSIKEQIQDIQTDAKAFSNRYTKNKC
jgi:hypothetical protein